MAEILLYGIIGDSFDKLDAATVSTAIRSSTGPLDVRINSAGGYVMEGLAIVAALRAYPGKVTVYIDGLAASMASVIAMCGAEIIMAESALLMIHNPWDQVVGDAPELRAQADKLDRIRDQMVGIYGKQTGLPEGELIAMLNAKTWFDAAQALAAGFVTSIAAPLKLAALADVSALGFRHTPDRLKETTMPDDTTQAVVTERTRISTIMALCDKHRLPSALSTELIGKGTALADARATILDHLAARDDAANIGHTVTGHQTLDNPATYASAVTAALVAKISGKPAAAGPAEQFQGMSVVEIARDNLARNGEREVSRMAGDRVVNMAMRGRNGPRAQSFHSGVALGGLHTTSDFPDLVGTAASTYLIERYKLQQSPLKQLARRRDHSNFLMVYGVQLGSFGALDTVAEGGEYKNRTIASRKEGYDIKTYGNMFAVSRQMLVNDGLGALADILNIMAAGAVETEAVMIAALINANPKMGDGVAWFHANHGNLAAAGGAPTIASLDAGRMAMRSQKDLAGGGLIDARPKFLLTGVGLETAAATLVSAAVAPTTAAEVNPFAGKIEPIADPRITTSGWYLFADPEFSPALQYSYLDGQDAPRTDSEDGWRVDGTEYKVSHDFGAGVMDHRLAWKNPGA